MNIQSAFNTYGSGSYGPRTSFARQLHYEKYRAYDGEQFEDAMTRVATTLHPDNATHRARLLEALLDQRFLPGGRIQAAIGSPKLVTAYNCYVSGIIPDSFVSRDNPQNSSIMHRAEQAATTMRMGGGIGYDFSPLRPNGALIEKLKSNASGPLGFMPVYNEVCRATSSAGNRRGAQMGVLRVDHPDIFDFVRAKRNHDKLTGFNISVAVTDEFMEHLDSGRPFELRHGGRVYRTIDPVELWEEIMESNWEWGEPGTLFIDTINKMNNLWYCEEITATNPCGEQPLPPFGACLLGSMNLVKYLLGNRLTGYTFDFMQFAVDVGVAVRALDAVIDTTIYPLPEQEAEAKSKRRMGLGVTGLANAAEAMGMPYGSPEFLEFEDRILSELTHWAYWESTELAEEKGSFPMFDAEKYLSGRFVKTLDPELRERIRKHGIRNSHLTSIAPTGTISMTADNVSSSIEPVFRWATKRRVIMPEGEIEVPLYDYGFQFLRTRGRRAAFSEVSVQQHVDVLTTAQRHVDSAVSKTVNCDPTMPREDFKKVYLDAYLGGAKGCTTFNSGGKRMGIFRVEPEDSDLPFPDVEPELAVAQVSADSAESCTWDPVTGRRSCE